MGQIFNRISRIFKANAVKQDAGFILDDDDEELKRIIEELNQEYNPTDDTRKNREEFKAESGYSEAYRILGLSPDSNIEMIKKAYKDKMRLYHPDKLHGKNKEEIESALENAKKINQAYQALKNIRNFN